MKNLRVVDIIHSSTDYLSKKGVPDPRLDAELLLGSVLQKDRLQLYLFFDRPLEKPELDQYRELIRRRGSREPLQHILGETGFMNLLFKTGPQALIPRPETEVLVEQAMQSVNGGDVRVLDIGTGTGCIAISLAFEMRNAKVYAIDISNSALELAKENARLNNANVEFSLIDIMEDKFPSAERFDLVVSNPPYISESERDSLQTEVREFDPSEALFGGRDGLSFYRRFSEILPELLKPGGRFMFEFGGASQEREILSIFSGSGYIDLEVFQDYNGDPRVISGKYKP
jgi:release factor glutamine methyltransferase